jgi:hypothetical protein
MSNTTDQVVVKLGAEVQELHKQVGELLEMIQSLQRNLGNAFREQGYNFEKIARIESSRRRETIQNNTEAVLDPEEFSPDFQDEVARKILEGKPLMSNQDLINLQHNNAGAETDGDISNSRAAVTEASNKGRKE